VSRFSTLEAKLAAHGATDPGGLADYIGKKKYGHTEFKALQAAGRKAHGDKRSMLTDVLRAREFAGRSYTIEDMTVRSDGDGRTVEAYAAAFNVPAEVRDQDGHYNEIITPGSFDKTINERGMRLTVLYNHGRTLQGTPDGTLSVPIGVPVEVPRADAHGVLTVTRYLNNPLADSILDAIKQRAITGQSFSGRFLQSKRTRESARGGLPTIHRNEVAWSEYGPTPMPYYMQAHVVGVRSAQSFVADIFAMDSDERAALFAEMVAMATPLAARASTETERESITVTAPTQTTEPAASAVEASVTVGDEPTRTETSTTPVVEPVDASRATATEAAGAPAEEPQQHSARQSDIARRARVARITRKDIGL